MRKKGGGANSEYSRDSIDARDQTLLNIKMSAKFGYWNIRGVTF